MKEKAAELADRLRSHESIKIISHIDADGITSGSIAYEALKRLDKDVKIEFIKQLEETEVKGIKGEDPELVWFTDLGSGQVPSLGGLNAVITDHHEPQGEGAIGKPSREERGDLLNYTHSNILELNPHRYDIDGATELCGAGTTYLVARELEEEEGDNLDLVKLAVIGAVGDFQANKKGKLIGKNREILKEGVSHGIVEKETDTQMYGVETRPLAQLLEYTTDPILPGLSGENEACVNFLVDKDIPLKKEHGDSWRTWLDLSKGEKRRIISGLANRMLDRGFPPDFVESLVGEVYTFPDEDEKTILHEAKEFSTLLNSCGRYGKGHIGMKVCLGDRDEHLDKAKELLKGHQRVLVDCMKYVESQGVVEKDYLQYFHGEERIPDTVVGTVAGMVLGSGDVSRDIPIVAFAESSERDGLKVSSRGTDKLVREGLDLSIVMEESSKELGGEGGGHDVAAGAFIPEGAEEDFLELAEDMIKDQIE